MGMISRMSVIVKSRMSRILDSAEDPGDTLDYSYEKQLEMLRGVKRGVVEMVAAKRQIQQQASKIQENVSRLELQARQALQAGREDMARLALQRKQTAVLELEGLDERISGMDLEQEKLIQAEQRLQAKVAAFRTKKEVIKAQFTSAPRPGAHRFRPVWHFRRDGRYWSGHRAGRNQNRPDAGPGWSHRRAGRCWVLAGFHRR